MSSSFSNVSKPRVCFIVESGTDVRLVEGMAERFELAVIARKILAGVEISQPPLRPLNLIVGPSSRASFARSILSYLRDRRQDYDHVIVQGYGLAALAANIARKFTKIPTTMLVCSPVEAYYKC